MPFELDELVLDVDEVLELLDVLDEEELVDEELEELMPPVPPVSIVPPVLPPPAPLPPPPIPQLVSALSDLVQMFSQSHVSLPVQVTSPVEKLEQSFPSNCVKQSGRLPPCPPMPPVPPVAIEPPALEPPFPPVPGFVHSGSFLPGCRMFSLSQNSSRPQGSVQVPPGSEQEAPSLQDDASFL